MTRSRTRSCPTAISRSSSTSPTSRIMCPSRLRASTSRRAHAATAFTSSIASSPCCRKSSATASVRCMPDVDRLVKTAIVTLEPQRRNQVASASPRASSTARNASPIKRRSRMLKKPAASLAARQKHVHALNDMAQVLRKAALCQGRARPRNVPEIKVRVNEFGIPTHLEKMENDISHQLIEEFMLLANEVVALELKRRNRPGLYRIHETPDPGSPAGIPRAGEVDGLFQCRRPDAARRNPEAARRAVHGQPGESGREDRPPQIAQARHV